MQNGIGMLLTLLEHCNTCTFGQWLGHRGTACKMERVVAMKWLISWLAHQGVWDSNPSLAATVLEIVYLLLPLRDMTEILL